MTNSTHRTLCTDSEIAAMIDAYKRNPSQGLRELEQALAAHPSDARLHFLKGSWLAGQEDYAAARPSMRYAIELAPNYSVARFQLGLLELTSGEAIAAQETWGPLHGLPQGNYLRLFVMGLCHLIRDEFADAVRCLEEGVSLNRENEPVNHDMRMVADEIRKKHGSRGKGGEAVSSVGLLLQQAALKSRH
jgi:Flp pilus assembly protein TadD